MRQIHELQTLETRVLVRDKALKAFDKLRLPTFVEHASLQMKCLGGMPGALTQLFWDNLEHKLCDIVKCLGTDEAFATSTIGFCNGCNLFVYEEKKAGRISEHPRGTRQFQWDTIFVPEGEVLTYGEMTLEHKNAISQRRKAFDLFLAELSKVLAS